MATDFPRRIVCLSDETTEILYALGAEDRIVGVSKLTVRPAAARRKPRVAAFSTTDADAVLALAPDLVLAFSDVQAEITRELVLRGATVLAFNQRTVAEVLDVVRALGRLVGKAREGDALAAALAAGLEAIRESARRFPRRPRVFFEEWHDPLISGIAWVEELVEIAGGDVVFPELRGCGKSRDRVVDAAEVRARDPEVIVASWCGKAVRKRAIAARPGWDAISAVRDGHVYEIRSSLILQPGPAALTEGVRQLHAILAHVVGAEVPAALRPREPTDATLLAPSVSDV
nr:ABC transporter substrate-binding protein [Gemmatirosa kalamazoonensis]